MSGLNTINKIYFLGIGGIGMSAIARYFNKLGKEVSGYDKTPTPLTNQLTEEGIKVFYNDEIDLVTDLKADETLIVLTPAIPKEHKQLNWFKENNFNIQKRAQVLGIISNNSKTIGVAGTHGKTTTSTMVAHILNQSKVKCNAFLGGISANYNNNLILSEKESEWLVVEADEFDRSFLTLYPTLAIITSTDADHLDIYGEHDSLLESFSEYAHQLKSDGTLIIKKELDLRHKLKVPYVTYSIKEKADYYAENIALNKHEVVFDLITPTISITNISLGIPGYHNIENAVAASAAALLAGVEPNELKLALSSFKGVKRRFEYIIKTEEQVFIDDYAHHPEEINAFLKSVKAMYPKEKLIIAFQPHLFSRTRDFAKGFSEALSIADEVLLLDIYPARELPIEGITSEIILNNITSSKKIVSKTELIDYVKANMPKLFCTLGAGDIEALVQPIKQVLNNA